MQPDRALNIRHYAALAATVRHGTLTRAARAINLSQPALTQAIGGLEKRLAINLFARGAGGMTPTDAALLLAPRAEAAIAHVGSSRVTGTQIRAYLAVARTGSYAGAAERTGLAPASIHRAVSDLSVALGQRLVERRGRAIVITPAGARRARGFGLAMAELRAGEADVAALLGRAGERISIGAMPLCRVQWLPDAIAAFTGAHPHVDITVHEGSHGELAGPLRDGELDMMLGALREGRSVDDLAQEPVFDDYPAIVLRRGHPVQAADDLPKALLEYPWLMPHQGTPLRLHWEEMIRSLGREPPHVTIECGSVATLRRLLIAGDYLTLLSPTQVATDLHAGLLTAIPPPHPMKRVIGISTRRDWRPTGAQAAFIAVVRQLGAAINNS